MLFIPVEDIAEGDFSPLHGTVEKIVESTDSIELIFKNGDKTTVPRGEEIEVTQGGRFDRRAEALGDNESVQQP